MKFAQTRSATVLSRHSPNQKPLN